MSKTDTVARFSLISARKVHFSENRSVLENFFKNWSTKSVVDNDDVDVVEDHNAVRRAWKVECTGQRQVSAWCVRAWCVAVV